jgi:hypothetical protein
VRAEPQNNDKQSQAEPRDLASMMARRVIPRPEAIAFLRAPPLLQAGTIFPNNPANINRVF